MVVSQSVMAGGSNTGLAKYNAAPSLPLVAMGGRYDAARAVASCVDWLTVSVSVPVPDIVTSYLLELLSVCEDHTDSGYTFGGVPLMVVRGTRVRPIQLHSDLLHVDFLAAADVSVTAQLTVYSPYFWQVGFDVAVSHLQDFANFLWQADDGVTLVPSRLDLARDCVGLPMPSMDEVGAFVDCLSTRARSVDTRGFRVAGGVQVQTLYIGSSGSPARLRLYDKSAELLRSGKTYYQDAWRAAGWSDGESVTRAEWQLSRTFFREWRCTLAGQSPRDGTPLRDVWDLLDQITAIWEYLMMRHCRMLVPSDSDSNRSRWRTAAWWVHCMGSPFLAAEVVNSGARWCRRQFLAQKLAAQALGAFTTFLALVGSDHAVFDDDDLITAFLMEAHALEERRAEPWHEMVARRRGRILASAA